MKYLVFFAILFYVMHNTQSLIINQTIIKLINGRGFLLSRTKPLQTTTGLLSNIPRLEYGIRSLFKSREASFYNFDIQPSISMDWKIHTSKTVFNIFNLGAVSSAIKFIFNNIFRTASVIASILKSSTVNFAQFLLPSVLMEPVHRFYREREELRSEYATYQWYKITQSLEKSALAL